MADKHTTILCRELLGQLKNNGNVEAAIPTHLGYDSVMKALEAHEGLVNLLPSELETGHVLEDAEPGGTCMISGAHFFNKQEVETKTLRFQIQDHVEYTYKSKPDLPVSKFQLPSDLPAPGLRKGESVRATIPVRYGFVHQCAYHGRCDSLELLATLPGVELALPNLHGETILQIAQHRLHSECTSLARELLEQEYDKAVKKGDLDYHRHLSRALAAPMQILHTGTLSNIPFASGIRAAPVMQSGSWMIQCLRQARLHDSLADKLRAMHVFDEDWLFARMPLAEDAVLRRVLDYVKAALPTHRSSHQALANVLAGGSLFGKKRLGDFTRSLVGVEPREAEKRIMDMCHKAVHELSEKLFVMCSAHDLNPTVRNDVVNFLVQTLRWRLTEVPSESLPDGVNFAGTVNLEDLQMEIATLKSKVGNATESWKKKAAVVARRCSAERNAFLDRLDSEIITLRDSLLTFVRLASGSGPGIGYELDKVFGTDNGLFAMLGPNGNNGYGPVAFAFEKSILSHPDVDMTANAATLYSSKASVCVRRPWVVTGVQSVPEAELPTKETAGYGFKEGHTSRPVKPLGDGHSVLSDYQGMYAWKFNQLNAYMSLEWEEVLAREIVAQARFRFSGMRGNFKGTGKYSAGADPWSEATTWNVDRSINWDKLRDEFESRVPEKEAAELIIKFYESCEGHAKVECHMPGVIHMGSVKHIWMTQQAASDLVSRRDMHQAEDPGGMMLRPGGLILADGRVLKILREADGTLRSDSPRWLTICADDQDLFEQQQAFFKRRLREASHDRYALHPIPGMSFRTESNLRNLASKRHRPGGTRWLPPLLDHPAYLDAGPRRWDNGFRIMFTANTGDDMELIFSNVPDGETTCDCYKLDVGFPKNQETRLFKIARGKVSIKLVAPASEFPTSVCATASAESGGCLQTYWASLTYQEGKAWLLFGRHSFGKSFPKTLRLRRSGEKYSAAGDSPVCVPVLCDECPLKDVRYIGFSCWSIAKAYQHVTIHRAPYVEVV